MPHALREQFGLMQRAAANDPFSSHNQRDRRLAGLQHLLEENSALLSSAIASDFGHRSHHETLLLEVFPILEAVRFARQHLEDWMAPQSRKTSRWFLPGNARVHYEPLGVVGIIAPWNYPLHLAFMPLVAALAAGNRVMLKLAELVPRTAELMQRLLSDSFDADEVCAIIGGAEVGKDFARLPFDHLLFTGSTAVGREVLKAAAENLTPVTLELGGKSPAIVATDYPLMHAAQRVMLGKCFNAGQTCIAPDYVLVPQSGITEFLQEASRAARELYPDGIGSADYTSIIDERHYNRLRDWLAEAEADGARVVPLWGNLEPDRGARRFPPVAVVNAPDHCTMMREEIFGPLLPVIGYDFLETAINHVAQRARPLALYYFDKDQTRIAHMLKKFKAGGVTINDVLFHIAQEDLPFGGVGASGLGRYHGREGFVTFSNTKAIFFQSRLAPVTLVRPPFVGPVDRLVHFLARRRLL